MCIDTYHRKLSQYIALFTVISCIHNDISCTSKWLHCGFGEVYTCMYLARPQYVEKYFICF